MEIGSGAAALVDFSFVPVSQGATLDWQPVANFPAPLRLPITQLQPGSYRLKMTYRRNNQTVDPGSQIFSEAGNSASEHVTLDIP